MFKNQFKTVLDRNILINKAKVATIAIVNKNGNFVHDGLHINSVEGNVLSICEGEKINSASIFYLHLSALWHDVGRVDLDEKEVIPHENASVLKFKEWARENNIDKTITDKVSHIILKHRNRKARNKTIDKLSAILWDADKLDIINIARCNRILFAYEKGINNNKSEYNFQDTLNFWKNIDDDFADFFHTYTGKVLFIKRFKLFKQLLEKKIKNSVCTAKNDIVK